MRTLSALVATLALTASGCFFEAFDPAGHACSTQADCLEGYRCEANVCVAGEPSDAGMDADLDALVTPDAPDAVSPPDATLDAGPDAGPDALVIDVGTDAPADDASVGDDAGDDASAGDDAGDDASVGDDAGTDASVGDDAGTDAAT